VFFRLARRLLEPSVARGARAVLPAFEGLHPSSRTQMTERNPFRRSSLSLDRDAALRLALPMALVGAAGGWLTADTVPLTSDVYFRALLTIVTSLATAGLGGWLGTRRRRGVAATIAIAALATAFAGIVNGAVVGVLSVGDGFGVQLGVMMGAVSAIPFIPVVVGLALLARRIGGTRVGSIVDGVDRRMVWIGALTAVALAAALPEIPAFKPDLAWISLSLPAAAAIALGALLLLDVRAFVRTRAIAARDQELVARPAGARDAAPITVDVGLGYEERVAIGRSGTANGDRDEVTLVVRGNPTAAARAIEYSLAIDAVALTIALGSAWVRIAKEVARAL
jgi:hypothetical protein